METLIAMLEAVRTNRVFKDPMGGGYSGALEVTQNEAVEAWREAGYPMPAREMLNPLMVVSEVGGQTTFEVLECENCAARQALAEKAVLELQRFTGSMEALVQASQQRTGRKPPRSGQTE